MTGIPSWSKKPGNISNPRRQHYMQHHTKWYIWRSRMYHPPHEVKAVILIINNYRFNIKLKNQKFLKLRINICEIHISRHKRYRINVKILIICYDIFKFSKKLLDFENTRFTLYFPKLIWLNTGKGASCLNLDPW